MLTITIIFAFLVAVWGSPSVIAMFARHASSRPRPAHGDDAVPQPRGTRSTASAGR